MKRNSTQKKSKDCKITIKKMKSEVEKNEKETFTPNIKYYYSFITVIFYC